MFSFLSNPMVKMAVVAVAVVLGIASYQYFKLAPGNIVEKASEEVIKYETGVDVDLDPAPAKK